MTFKDRIKLWICDFCIWTMRRVLGLRPAARRSPPDGELILVFNTRDRGRTWTIDGRQVACTPLSDCLQDAWTNHEAGWPIETDKEKRRWLIDNGYSAETRKAA